MYDKSLMQDLKEFKIGAYTIDDIQYRYENINKIVKNRTKEKMDFLKYMIEINVINNELYEELVSRVESDYKISNLYIMGMISELDL